MLKRCIQDAINEPQPDLAYGYESHFRRYLKGILMVRLWSYLTLILILTSPAFSAPARIAVGKIEFKKNKDQKAELPLAWQGQLIDLILTSAAQRSVKSGKVSHIVTGTLSKAGPNVTVVLALMEATTREVINTERITVSDFKTIVAANTPLKGAVERLLKTLPIIPHSGVETRRGQSEMSARTGQSLGKGFCRSEDISAVVTRRMRGIQYCYERALARQPELSGQVKMEWRIELNGRTSHVEVLKSSLKNAQVENCMARNIKRWRFPKPTGGHCIVRYPFAFNATD